MEGVFHWIVVLGLLLLMLFLFFATCYFLMRGS